MALRSAGCLGMFLILFVFFAILAAVSDADVLSYTFVIKQTPVTKLCKQNNIVTVNDQLPGPTVYAHNGDTIVVKTYNRCKHNATLHWHGVRQLGTAWADGTGYITQCPIQPGGNYTYRFNITRQEGTLWWHAHVSWLRATVYGAIVLLPKKGSLYPFPKPSSETLIILGEWWNVDPIAVVDQALLTGGAPNISDAFTINGQPGDLYPCSTNDTFRLSVKKGETYLLRIVSAAVNNQHFFMIANHEFTVVAVDASYTKPYKTGVMVIAPGQSADVLLTANQPVGKYYMAARPYSRLQSGYFDNTTTTAILEYMGDQNSTSAIFPRLPLINDTATVTAFTKGLRSLASQEHPVHVPQSIDETLIYTVGLGLIPCPPPGRICEGPNGTRLSASVNNVTFVLPTTALLQASYFKINGVFTTDFPSNPPVIFDYTGQSIPGSLWAPVPGTKVKVLNYNSSVQLVFQGTNIFVGENHPMHLHGYSFYVVGEGFGNYNPQTDPLKFNLVDPPKRNTVGVPANGWTAIRFRADNPGVWFLHCHFDDHLSWGLTMAFLVKNGAGYLETLGPPPPDLPKC